MRSRKTTHDGWNRTTKRRKNQNAWRKGNLLILGNIGSRHHQISGHGRTSISGERENYLKPNYIAELSSKGQNVWVVLLMRSSGPFLKWTREELQQIDKKNHDVNRLYVSRKEERRGLTSNENSNDASI